MRSALLHCYIFLGRMRRALSRISDFGLSENPLCAAIWAVLMRLCAVGWSLRSARTTNSGRRRKSEASTARVYCFTRSRALRV